MDVEELLRAKLKELGADGLMIVDYDGCGCTLDDFMPCGGDNIQECVAARLVDCTHECDHGEQLAKHFEPLGHKSTGESDG